MAPRPERPEHPEDADDAPEARRPRTRAPPQRPSRAVQPKDDSGEEPTTAASARWKPGPCRVGVCGMEAACEPKPRNSHTCICPHDKSPPTGPGMRCLNRSVVPATSSPIHNIIPPIPPGDAASPLPVGFAPGFPPAAAPPPHLVMMPHLEPAPATRPTKGVAGAHWTLPVGMGIFGAAVLLAGILVWVVRRRAIRARKRMPCSLRKGPLGSELFLPNPQYALFSAQGVTGLAPARGEHAIISSQALTLQESIGEGCFGKVYRGELMGPDASLQTVAVKMLKESATREAEEDFMREVEVMSAFQHPHILRLIGVVPREPHSAPGMVFEFMPFGDLTEVLRCSGKNPWAPPRPGLPPLTQDALLSVALQIGLGMRYLAAQRFVHRDLACRNCLVGHNLTVKIADFGMSRDVYTCDYYKMGGSRALPVRWMSPEALLYGRFTLESDVWSFGVVLWEVFTRGKLPYYGHANEEAMKLVLQGVLLQLPESSECPPAVVELMRCCWKTEPRDRLRFPEVCSRLEDALDESLKGLNESDLPRPPAFPAAYPALPDDLPPLDELGGDELLDPENYLLPRPPDPSHVQYLEPIAD